MVVEFTAVVKFTVPNIQHCSGDLAETKPLQESLLSIGSCKQRIELIMAKEDHPSSEESSRLAELEAKAVAEATATADESFTPSPSLLNASSPQALLQQVDGPSLSGYEAKESVYVGKSVPIVLRGKMEVPIHVTAPGSIVEYSIESKGYDISFGVVAEREEGVTLVKVRSHENFGSYPSKQC